MRLHLRDRRHNTMPTISMEPLGVVGPDHSRGTSHSDAGSELPALACNAW